MTTWTTLTLAIVLCIAATTAATTAVAVGADAPEPSPTSSVSSTAPALVAAPPEVPAPPHRELHWQSGTVIVQGGVATIALPPDTTYLQQDDARYVMETLYKNPPDPETLGLIRTRAPDYPLVETGNEDDQAVYATVSYDTEQGHIKDDDAATANYADLLKKIQQDAKDAAPERRKAGFFGYEILGWAEPPHYDQSTHMVYWATSMKADGLDEPQMNYNLRLLGARGILVIDYLEPTAHLAMVRAMAAHLIPTVRFSTGNAYADFKPGYDKVAAYGIAGLIAGGVLLKTGFFSLILKFLVAFIKPIIAGCVILAGSIARFFGGKKKDKPPTESPDTAPPPVEDPGNSTPFNRDRG